MPGRSASQATAAARWLVIDVDHFKEVNARFGRSWGDEALRVISNVIRASVRSGDLVGRLGGEEFGIFSCSAHGAERRRSNVAERVRKVTLSRTLCSSRAANAALLTVSVGGIVFEDQLIFDELIEAAEEQLLSAKTNGRNRTSIGAVSLRAHETRSAASEA